MPSDLAGKEEGFGEEFLLVIFTKVKMVMRSLVEGEDVVGRLEFGDGNKADAGLLRLFSSLDPVDDGGDIRA